MPTPRLFILVLLSLSSMSTAAVAAPLKGSIVRLGFFLDEHVETGLGDDFVALSLGSRQGIALRADGSLAAWRQGWGNSVYELLNVPVGNNFSAIAAGVGHSLALRTDGSIVSWEDDPIAWGTYVWDETFDPNGAPTGNDYSAISAGYQHNLALRSDGSIVAWGADFFGLVSNTPLGNDFTAIAAGARHNVALRQDGSLIAWGDNTYGQLNVPAGNDFIAIDTGATHSIALKADGSVVTWGELPLLDFYYSPPPSDTDFVSISSGHASLSGIKENGNLVGWGLYHVDWPLPPIELEGNFVAASASKSLLTSEAGTVYAIVAVPEPSTLVLAGLAAVCGLFVIRRRGR